MAEGRLSAKDILEDTSRAHDACRGIEHIVKICPEGHRMDPEGISECDVCE